MKTKCPICTTTKGKRDCLLNSGELICSRCCAQTRSEETCSECSHYHKAEQEKVNQLAQSGNLHTLIEPNPEVEDSVDQALIQLENGNSEQALEKITPLLEQHPNNHTAQYAMGCIFAMTGKIQESIPHFQKSIEIFPYFIEGWHNLGMSHRRVANVSDAIICAQKVIQFGTHDDPVVISSREFIKDFEKQIQQEYNLTLKQYLDNLATFDKAYQNMENGNIPEAMQGFQIVLKTEPTHYQSHGNLAICHAMLGEKQKALTHLDKALELNPDYAVAASNKPIFEAMKEGEKLVKPVQSVNYGATGMKPI